MDPTPTPVRAIHRVGSDAIALNLDTPEGFDARPGQFVKLTVEVDGETRSRFYTLSSPTVEKTFETTIEIDPEGELGPRLAALEPGDTIEVAGPFGSAHYEGEASTAILAGGPGVGPAVGIAERTLDDGGETAVIYRDDEPIHRERLDALRDAGAFVSVLDENDDLTSTVEQALADREPQVFIYGFAEFLDAATDALGAAGGDPDRAKVENFG